MDGYCWVPGQWQWVGLAAGHYEPDPNYDNGTCYDDGTPYNGY